MSNEEFYIGKVSILPNGRLTARNAALYLGIAEKTLAMYRCAGTGPRFTKIRGRVYYTLQALNNWLDKAGEHLSTQQARLYQQRQEGV